MREIIKRVTVILLALAMAILFIPAGGMQKAYADGVEYGEIRNVAVDSNGVMTWDPVEGVSGYYICIDGLYWDAVSDNAYEVDNQIDYCIVNGIVENRGNHTIMIEGDSPDKYFTWEGTRRHFLNNKETDTLFRYYGSTRYETSIKVADAYKKKMGVENFSSIILAYGKNYADALAGSYLSSNANAPILLVDSDQSHINAVQNYIRKNLTSGGTIYLLGGKAVVPDAAVAGLSGYTIKRLGGSDRYATNLEILKEGSKIVPWFEYSIIICSGTGFADSLSAAATGKPIMLVRGKSLTNEQKSYLKSLKESGSLFITIVGGEGAVSKDLFGQLKAYGTPYRVWGNDRYETSKAFADYYFGQVSAAVAAYGQTFPDGLCGGSLANAMGGPLILAANGRTAGAAEYAKGHHIMFGAILGGPALISDASAKAIFDVSDSSRVVTVE